MTKGEADRRSPQRTEEKRGRDTLHLIHTALILNLIHILRIQTHHFLILVPQVMESTGRGDPREQQSPSMEGKEKAEKERKEADWESVRSARLNGLCHV